MTISATAPGKLVVLGEYAVLSGSRALVMAVDRLCRVEIAVSDDEFCHLETVAPDPDEQRFAVGEPSGAALVDLVIAPDSDFAPWHGTVDTAAFFEQGQKLGAGSSAAVLVAWDAAWSRYTGLKSKRSLEGLIGLHRSFQGGKGSGLDIAASLTGGVISYELGHDGIPTVGNVGLPDGVLFKVIYSGKPAATSHLVAAFDAWRDARPDEAGDFLGHLGKLARRGLEATKDNDATAFLAALKVYGDALDELGGRIGAEIVTSEHKEIIRHSERFDVVYKISGAGGGDVGIGWSQDPDALTAFEEAVASDYKVLDIDMYESGMLVEGRASG
ncbi:MAG: mevalonate kinase family protein [Gammaproteobacteria bacterium]